MKLRTQYAILRWMSVFVGIVLGAIAGIGLATLNAWFYNLGAKQSALVMIGLTLVFGAFGGITAHNLSQIKEFE